MCQVEIGDGSSIARQSWIVPRFWGTFYFFRYQSARLGMIGTLALYTKSLVGTSLGDYSLIGY